MSDDERHSRRHADSRGLGGSPIARLLPLVLVGLVLLAVLPVLVLGYMVAQDNTGRLLRDRSEMTIDNVVNRITAHLEPPRQQLQYLQAAVKTGTIDIGSLNQAGVQEFVLGTLAATPQVAGIGHISPDGSMRRHNRSDFSRYDEDSNRVPNPDESLAAAQRDPVPQWLSTIWSPILQEAIVRLVASLYGPDGEFKGAVVAAITTSALSQYLRNLNEQGSPVAFVLAGPDRVVAHPYLADRAAFAEAHGENPLPSIEAIGDPVLAEIWSADRSPLTAIAPFREAEGHWTWVGDESYAFVYRTLVSYGDQPWTVGIYYPGNQSRRERWMVQGIAIGGAILLCISLGAAVLVGRRLGRPILELASVAKRIEALDFDSVRNFPLGAIREVNRAGKAIEHMAAGLRLFEIYVPRALVRRLIAAGSKRPESQVRDVTIMFTDLEGYTRYSAGRPAPEIAEYLNAVLASIGPAIESSGGTIDNFMGDGVMAFWGAPETREDHADAACKTALEIAKSISSLNEKRRHAGLASCRLRIGIHTGPAVVGNIGFEGRVHYTIVGEAVNVAQRIEQLGRNQVAGVGEAFILVSKQTKETTTRAFRFNIAFDHLNDRLQAAGPIFRLTT